MIRTTPNRWIEQSNSNCGKNIAGKIKLPSHLHTRTRTTYWCGSNDVRAKQFEWCIVKVTCVCIHYYRENNIIEQSVHTPAHTHPTRSIVYGIYLLKFEMESTIFAQQIDVKSDVYSRFYDTRWHVVTTFRYKYPYIAIHRVLRVPEWKKNVFFYTQPLRAPWHNNNNNNKWNGCRGKMCRQWNWYFCAEKFSFSFQFLCPFSTTPLLSRSSFVLRFCSSNKPIISTWTILRAATVFRTNKIVQFNDGFVGMSIAKTTTNEIFPFHWI